MRCNYLTLENMVKRKICYGIVQPGQSVTDGIPVIKVNNLISGLKSLSELDTTTRENEAKYIRTRLHGGELIISVVGTIGKTAIVPKSFAGCNLVRATALIDIEDALLSKWVKYYIDSPYGQSYIEQNLNTTVQPTLNIRSLEKMSIPLYDAEYMKKIVILLSSLDEKIAINREINDNLEQQAFSVFDNLIANAENNDRTVSDYAFLNPKRTLAKNQVARSIDMSQLSTSGAFPSSWEMKPFNGGMRFTNGDTLLARITPCLENGKTAFIDFLDDGEVAFGSTEYIVLAPKNDTPPEMLYCLARYPAFVDYAVKNMNGSSGRQRVSAETVGQYRLPLFDKHSLVLFKEVVSPMFLKMRYNSLENMRLAELRDALLPKLMSGEVDVSDIQL